MRPVNNYAIQAQNAKRHFLSYDQSWLIAKCALDADDMFLYTRLLSQCYRINRKTGDLEKKVHGCWEDANTHEEVMTLLDLICDSREDRFLSGRWQSMQNFGLMFHQNLLENEKNPTALWADRHPDDFRRGCEALGGQPFSGADMGYTVELYDGLSIAIQFWHGDEDFLPRLRYLWDENALMYIRYETMYFAVELLTRRLREQPIN